MERLAAEEYEKERVRASRARPDLNLTLEQSEAWPSSSRSSTPSSFASQEDAEAELETESAAIAYGPGRSSVGNILSSDSRIIETNLVYFEDSMKFIYSVYLTFTVSVQPARLSKIAREGANSGERHYQRGREKKNRASVGHMGF